MRFSLPSWGQSTCPCGKTHREMAFIFPPKKLERVVFKRVRSDGIQAIFLGWSHHRKWGGHTNAGFTSAGYQHSA
jgi:hypothetical protein